MEKRPEISYNLNEIEYDKEFEKLLNQYPCPDDDYIDEKHLNVIQSDIDRLSLLAEKKEKRLAEKERTKRGDIKNKFKRI